MFCLSLLMHLDSLVLSADDLTREEWMVINFPLCQIMLKPDGTEVKHPLLEIRLNCKEVTIHSQSM